MAGTEAELLGEALAGTEKEIFQEAFGEATDDTNDDATDTSLEEMEDDVTSDVTGAEDGDGEGEAGDEDGETDGETADGKGEGDKPDAKPKRAEDGKFTAEGDKPKAGEKPGEQDKPRRGDPNVALSDERRRARTLQTDLEKERADRATERDGFKTEFAKLEGRLDQMLRTQQAPKAEPKTEAVADPEPDMFVDPDGWKAWNSKQHDQRFSALQQTFDERLLNSSMALAHESHGKAFEDAYGALTGLPKTPESRAVVNRIKASPNPGSALMRWHKSELARQEVGDDVGAFKERVTKEARDALLKDPEFRKEFLSHLRGEAGTGDTSQQRGAPRNIIRNPRSLNSEGGRAERANDNVDNDGSDSAIFKSATAELR